MLPGMLTRPVDLAAWAKLKIMIWIILNVLVMIKVFGLRAHSSPDSQSPLGVAVSNFRFGIILNFGARFATFCPLS